MPTSSGLSLPDAPSTPSLSSRAPNPPNVPSESAESTASSSKPSTPVTHPAPPHTSASKPSATFSGQVKPKATNQPSASSSPHLTGVSHVPASPLPSSPPDTGQRNNVSSRLSPASSSSTPAHPSAAFGPIQTTVQSPASDRANTTHVSSINLESTPNVLVTSHFTQTSGQKVPPTSNIISNPTSVVLSSHPHSDFFANRGAVAGVFAAVGLIVICLGFFIFAMIRRCGRRADYDNIEPSLPNVPMNQHEGGPHYRRVSQVLRDSTLRYASAAGAGPHVGNQSFVGSDGSHARSQATYNSRDPIVENPFSGHHTSPSPVPEDYGVSYNPPSIPFASISHQTMQSAVETSPSIYPPTLPAAGDDGDRWRQPTPILSNEETTEDDMGEVPLTPQLSPLGLWTDSSETNVTTPTSFNSHDSATVKGLHSTLKPMMHKGSTALITLQPSLQAHAF